MAALRSAAFAGALAVLACLLLAARPASAMDPRLCFPGDWERIFNVKETKASPPRITNAFAAKENQKTVELVAARMETNRELLPEGCKLASWQAVEGCFNPATEGSNRFPARGDYGFRFFINFSCNGTSNQASFQVWAYPTALRSGRITSLDFNYAVA